MFKKAFKSFYSSEIYRNSAKLFFGHAFGQGVVFLSGPVLSRLYSPDEFGTYALMSSIAGAISVIGSGSYEYAIVTVKNEKEADTVSLLSIFLSTVASLVSAIILSIIFLKSGAWRDGFVGKGWILVPVFVLFQGFYNTTNFSLTRSKKYGTISVARSIRAVGMVPAQILLGIKGIYSGLYIGMVFGHFLGMSLQLKRALKDYVLALQTITIRDVKNVARSYYKFPLYYMPEQLINKLSSQSPVFLLKIFFNDALVGLYALPSSFLSVPVVIIGNSLGQIYFRDAAQKYNLQKDISLITANLFKFLFRLAVFPFGVLMIFGDVFVEFVFGNEWYQAGVYAMILSPWLLFLFVGSPLSTVFTVLGKQKESLVISFYLFLGRILAFFAGIYFFDSSLYAIGLFAAVSFGFWAFIAFYNLYLAKVRVFPVFIEVVSLLAGVLIVGILTRVFLFNFSWIW
ncbi:MAG: hypothetical protein PWR04_1119 [Anaerophaga sp.]|nr:hypothetical protein [Anaerophaga sp.]